MTEVVVCIQDTLSGPPTLWVPPDFYPSPILLLCMHELAHIPLERGGAGAGASSLLR